MSASSDPGPMPVCDREGCGHFLSSHREGQGWIGHGCTVSTCACEAWKAAERRSTTESPTE